MRLSFVIPAFNAADTIGRALDSLTAQQFGAWEAIVVDDGSSDGTPGVARAIGDTRISVITQQHAGAAAARNAGLALASGEWVAFLDADDWLDERFAECMLRRAEAQPDADVIYCNWTRVDGSGRHAATDVSVEPALAAQELRRRCVFAIHACIARRQILVAAGGFDRTMTCCEDWDLWLRLADAGARFAAVPERLSFYRLRPGSASGHGHSFVQHASKVLERAHPHDAESLAGHRRAAAIWGAGLLIGGGLSPEPVLRNVGNSGMLLPVSGAEVAEILYRAVPAGAGTVEAEWPALWPRVGDGVARALEALDRDNGRGGVLVSGLRALADRIMADCDVPSLTIGRTHGVEVEAFSPLRDLDPPPGCDRLVIRAVAGPVVARATLPVAAHSVPAGLVADSIAGSSAWWALLGEYLAIAVYPGLHITGEKETGEVRRGHVVLATVGPAAMSLHDRVGWIVWLQELFGEPGWTSREFYGNADGAAGKEVEVTDTAVVEVSETLPTLLAAAPVRIEVQVGGATVGAVSVAPQNGRIAAGRLRTTIVSTLGTDLCRAVLREAVLGRDPSDGVTLRARLARLAELRRNAPDPWYASQNGEVSDVIGRREVAIMATGLSRRALLPAAAGDSVLAAATACGEHVVRTTAMGNVVAYDPGLLPAAQLRLARVTERADDSSFFEQLFDEYEDPWNYGTAYEQRKYEQTLSLLHGRRVGRALEIACAEGHFTALLAAHADDVLATDVSARALARTAARCRALPNVRTMRFDVTRDVLPTGTFDLVVCSEVLYYVGDHSALRKVARKLHDMLVPGGLLLTAHANLAREERDAAGFVWDQPFGARGIRSVLRRTGDLTLTCELVSPLYRIGLYEKRPRRWWQPAPPVDERASTHAPLTAAVASQVKWRAPQTPSAEAPVLSRRVPILMYHRVSPDGAGPLGRYCLSPDAFEAQLRWLADEGYHSIGFDAWRDAVAHRRNILGRPVIVTFDDGFEDFAEFAQPRLAKYGFGATLFVVTGQVGRTSSWDGAAARSLLDWPALRRLRDQGIQIGAHSHTHPVLTAQDVGVVAREAADARRCIAQELGEAVSAFAYPYGEHDAVVRHIVGACGYRFGVTVRSAAAGFGDDLLDLPRLEVEGRMGVEQFSAMLGTAASA